MTQTAVKRKRRPTISTKSRTPTRLVVRSVTPMKYVSVDRLITIPRPLARKVVMVSPYIDIRGSGEFKDHAFYLDMYYDWVLGLDSDGNTVLIPLKKKGGL